VFAALGLWRFAIYAALIAAFVGYLAYEKGAYDDRRRVEGAAPYIAAIAAQKREAAILLQAETEKAAKVSKSWSDYARSSDDEYEKKIAVIRAAANSANGMRLISPERWNSSACATAGKDDTGTSKDASTSGKFLAELDAFLRSEASRADEIATYALSCYNFVNK
jgi:hypothetical protein